jgi:hypothetical protein
MDKRLALRMVFLLVAALLGGSLFVFHVRDMENLRLRRDLQGLAESLAIMLGPEQIQHLQNQQSRAAGPADADLARIRDQFRTVNPTFVEFSLRCSGRSPGSPLLQRPFATANARVSLAAPLPG